jgi:hypothetical protein
VPGCQSIGARPRAAPDALSNVYHTSFGVPVMMNLWNYYVLCCLVSVSSGSWWDSQGTPGLFADGFRVWWASSGDLTSRIGICP